VSVAALIIGALFAAYGLARAEFEKYELKKEISELREERDGLIEKLLKRPISLLAQKDDTGANAITQQPLHRRRPSFGAAKRILENQEAPPQRSVNS
jgi:hypothetical protein